MNVGWHFRLVGVSHLTCRSFAGLLLLLFLIITLALLVPVPFALTCGRSIIAWPDSIDLLHCPFDDQLFVDALIEDFSILLQFSDECFNIVTVLISFWANSLEVGDQVVQLN